MEVLNKTKDNVLVEFTIQEFNYFNNKLLFNPNDDNLDDYEFIFDEPIKASILSKTF